MPRRAPNASAVDALRDHYRKQPPTTAADFKRAAQLASVTEATARRAWSRGWRGVPAIEAQLADERAIAATSPVVMRAELLAERALHGAAELHAHVCTLRTVAGVLVARLASAAELGDLGDLSPAAALAHLRTISKIERDSMAIVAGAVEVQRLTSGSPTSIVQHLSPEPETFDLDSAKHEAEALLRAVQREESKRASVAKQLDEGTDDGVLVH